MAAAPDPEEIRKQARLARSVVWGVFVFALLACVGLRLAAGHAASSEIRAETAAVAALAAEGKTASEIVEARTEALYSTTDDPTAVGNYRPLVRALAHKLARMSAEDREKESQRSGPDLLWLTLLIVSVVQAIIILLFPTMFHIRTNAAVSHIERMQPTPANGERPLPHNFWTTVWLARHVRFLEGEGTKWMLWRRLGFATLMAGSSMYLLAPAGLTASIVGEFARLNSAPGSPSYPFWFTGFVQASPFVIGLSGYLLYSLTVFFRRALINDVSNKLFISGWNRGITVIVLSLALTGIDEGSNFSRAMVFVVGVFPQTGVQAIAKLAQNGVANLGRLQPAGFAELPEIGLLAETGLEELGVSSTVELANTDLDWLITASGVEPRALVTATDRALLHKLFTAAQVTLLATVPISTASELLLWVEGADCYTGLKAYSPASRSLVGKIGDAKKKARRAQLCEILGATDLELQIQEIAGHRNVQYVIEKKLSYRDL